MGTCDSCLEEGHVVVDRKELEMVVSHQDEVGAVGKVGNPPPAPHVLDIHAANGLVPDDKVQTDAGAS
jgi:alpha-D-ribose 1-methylphosphonate 5-triphosphate synthase subunit PhnI